jgi:hypothetical protein
MASAEHRGMVLPRSRHLVGPLAALLLVGARAAWAHDAPAPMPPPSTTLPVVPIYAPPPARGDWYGWQVFAVDGGVLAASLGCVLISKDASCVVVAGWGYALGGPVVHKLHGGWGRTFGSVGLRLGVPLLGALVGMNSGGCSPSGGEGDYCGLEAAAGAAGGALVGMAAAILIDGLWAWEDAPAPAPPPHWSVAPTMSLGRASAGIGLAGSF